MNSEELSLAESLNTDVDLPVGDFKFIENILIQDRDLDEEEHLRLTDLFEMYIGPFGVEGF